MRHPRTERWEAKLKKVFDQIDHRLEAEYGDRFSLHPARAKKGTTGNAETDGLFNVGAAFSAGYGSQHGRGYVVEVRMATLRQVPHALRERIAERVADWLREELPAAFPGRKLEVKRDGRVYKITGDLSLDKSA